MCLDSGAKKVLIPSTAFVDFASVPADLMSAFQLIPYQSAEDAVFKALGVEWLKKDLIELIDSQKEIEKMFHPFDDNVGILFEKISDVPEFQNWFQEIKLELHGIYDRTHDTFVGWN